MTVPFIALWLVLTVAFCLVNSLYVGSIWPTVCYAALFGAIAMGFAVYEKTRRQRLLDDVQKALDGKDDFTARESSLAPLARQLRLKRGEEETRDRRVTESYRNLAALVSDIAHQRKTPLTAAKMYAELLPASPEVDVPRAS